MAPKIVKGLALTNKWREARYQTGSLDITRCDGLCGRLAITYCAKWMSKTGNRSKEPHPGKHEVRRATAGAARRSLAKDRGTIP